MYEAVVQEIGGVLMTYDTDGRFPAFGFQGEFCFPLNGIESNPSVEGITGMISSFRQALANVKLKGNTHFEPVIQRAAQLASLPPTNGVLRQYIVMIILTDGKFTDQKKIVEAMATVSNLPISFVYVVVGDDPDGVNIKSFEELKNASRQYTNRDMIQIIQMNTLNDLSVNARSFTIARQMIKELPTQVVTYYAGLDIQPENAAVKFGNISLFGM
jgi:Copine